MPREMQLSLFEQTQQNILSIEDSASIARVSTGTIRNWIKTGYLKYAGKGMITNDSLEQFQKEVSGREKLNRRANKSKKDNHDHAALSLLYINKIANDMTDIELLGAEYEQSLSESYRNKEGIYYTPRTIVDDLFRGNFRVTETTKFCDPCCGSGNFVMRAVEVGFKVENIYAYDTDPVAISLTKKRIFEKTGIDSNNIVLNDFLESFNDKNAEKFDVIFTNPPWGKKLERKHREKIGATVHAGTSIDTCSLFFFACLEALLDDGILGLLLPEAFFNIASFENARKQALKYRIEKLIDYGKPFCGLLTKAQAVMLTKSSNTWGNSIFCKNADITSERTTASFRNNPKSILNLYCSQQDSEVISHLFSIPHITLKDNASWGLGIVTGNNDKFIKCEAGEGLMPVFKGSDITSTGMKEPSCYIPSDLSLYQQVAPIELYAAKDKIMYKFITSRLCFVHDTAQRIPLNSANILIPNSDFPVTPSVLCDLLNSEFMNWLFSKIYNTHKILRADLESLPIYSQFLDVGNFTENVYLDNLSIERSQCGTFRVKK